MSPASSSYRAVSGWISPGVWLQARLSNAVEPRRSAKTLMDDVVPDLKTGRPRQWLDCEGQIRQLSTHSFSYGHHGVSLPPSPLSGPFLRGALRRLRLVGDDDFFCWSAESCRRGWAATRVPDATGALFAVGLPLPLRRRRLFGDDELRCWSAGSRCCGRAAPRVPESRGGLFTAGLFLRPRRLEGEADFCGWLA